MKDKADARDRFPGVAFVEMTKADLERMSVEELHALAEDQLGIYLDINAEKGALLGRLFRHSVR